MGRPVHFEIHADDLDRAERFYTQIFSWKIERYEGSPIDYRLITTGPDDETPGINGAMLQRQGPAPAPGSGLNGFATTVAVDDLEATEKAIADSGGQRIVDPATLPGVGTFAYYLDTEGNVFGALQPDLSGS